MSIEHIYTVVTFRGDRRTEHLVRTDEPPDRVEFIVEKILRGLVYCYAPASETTLLHHPVELPLTLDQLVRGWWSANLYEYRALQSTGHCLSVFTECMEEELDKLKHSAAVERKYIQTSIKEIEEALCSTN